MWKPPQRIRHPLPVRRCIYTKYCEGLDQMHKQVTCQLWDGLDVDEAGVRLSVDGKRRLTPRWDPSC